MARILVVDDEATLRNLIMIALQGAEYSVVDAPDAWTGLDVLEQDSEIELVITDFTMPGMNGLEFGFRVRERYPDKKLILMTALVGAEANRITEEAVLEIGFEMVICKPFGLPVFLGAVERALAKK